VGEGGEDQTLCRFQEGAVVVVGRSGRVDGDGDCGCGVHVFDFDFKIDVAVAL
jgi:hypothetical protein